ncbi:MAG: TrbI F-type domain-containing protein [Gammaproteobacteria bacterium]|nr:TrbI F-type domain-containing protein [Gammaproteobacteria bacterium]
MVINKNLLLALGISIISSCITACVVCNACQAQIGLVDIGFITKEFIKKEAASNHNSDEKKIAIRTFSHRLEISLEALSHNKSLILLPKEAAVKGGKDYTQDLIERMEHAS